jgi:hypothetical protein
VGAAQSKHQRIQQRYTAKNKSEIAQEEKYDRETVARIMQFPKLQNFIAQAQQEFLDWYPTRWRLSKSQGLDLTHLGHRRPRLCHRSN